MSEESRTYQDMLLEVEGIVEQLSDNRVDLDQMVEKVEQGFDLIKTMKMRLSQTKSKIEELRIEFDETLTENLES